MIFAVSLCYVSSSERLRPEKLRPELDLNPDLCDAGTVLHQLSYQANWEMVDHKPVDSGYTCM